LKILLRLNTFHRQTIKHQLRSFRNLELAAHQLDDMSG
jgi:hypothetical protein